jgi:hypothetical protein
LPVTTILERTHIVVTPNDSSRDDCLSILDSQPLLLAAKQRLFGCQVDVNHTNSVRTLVRTAVGKVVQRFEQYKQFHLPHSSELQCHWVLEQYRHNIASCCQLIGIMGQLNLNIEALRFDDSLLRPKAVAHASYIAVTGEESVDQF